MADDDDDAAKATKGKLPKYPADHQVGMRVPKGGSSCAKCVFVREADTECAQKDFIAWHGSDHLPAPADSYCCDFFTTRTTKRTARDLRREK